ncbi:MAG: integrase arm-type DNA-binding domain-containing protein [Spirochaetaceae bacterium]|nr:integrase arm-type DNA-binding domain-containing protein [Spirochaetaceae bacterium]
MAKRLTAAKVRKAAPGVHGDQFGLRLRVLASGARTWVWRGTVNGRRVDLGLGGYPVVTLAEARDLALECKRAAHRGDDPRSVRGRRGIPTFGEAAETVIRLHAPTWKGSGRTEDQWRHSLREYASALEPMRLDKITATDILAVLTPVWHKRPETAARVRTRISAVLKWAVAQGHRHDDPSEAVKAALPRAKREKVHHAAVAHAGVADVLKAVLGHRAWWGTRLAVVFATLTATRSGEARQARWSEIDGDTWTVPGSRSKVGKDHRVPLSRQALDILEQARTLGADRDGDVIFPRARGTDPVAGGVLMALLRDIGANTTLHGMARASFRSWAADCGESREDAEMALGHVVQGVEGAYQRSDLCERRRALMARWGSYVMP